MTSGSGYEVLADFVSIENLKGSNYNDTLAGSAAANAIDGFAGNDVINGLAGNDTLTGGMGSDTFVFNAGWGQDTVTDFTRSADMLDFTGVAGLVSFVSFVSFAQLSITASGGNAVVAFGVRSVTLTGVAASSLTAGDVMFH